MTQKPTMKIVETTIETTQHVAECDDVEDVIDRFGDQPSEFNSVEVSGLVRTATQRLAKPTYSPILLDDRTYQGVLLVDGEDSQLNLAAQLGQLPAQVRSVPNEQSAPNLVRSLHDGAKAQREHGALGKGVSQDTGVSQHLLAP